VRWLYRLPGGPALLGPARRMPEVPLPAAVTVARRSWERPSTYVLVAAYALGLWRIGTVLGQGFSDFPLATITAAALVVVFAVPFVLLVRVIDFLEREPLGLQVLAILWGGVVATSAALSGGAALQNLLAKVFSPAAAARWGPAVTGAAVEELVMVDGFVYGALVGLGFQLIEDMVFALSAVALDAGVDAIAPVIGSFLVRGFLGGLWSHTLFTALAGAGVAYALTRRSHPAWQRTAVALLLFGLAAGFHFLWNSPFLAVRPPIGLLGVVAVVLVKGIPALLVGVALLLAAERREAHYYSGLLARAADPQIASQDEIATLVSPRRRVAARRRARDRLGWTGTRAVRRLQRAQAQLAVALSRDPGAEVLRRRRDVLSRRHQLLALSMNGQDRPRRGPLAMAAFMVGKALLVALVVLGLAVAIRDLT
jgi:RsiW-degrading membrane proteinase PrsW (M82 family)